MQFDFSKLRGRIKEKVGSEAKFAKKIGISSASLSAKFNNRTDFSTGEISRAAEKDVLDIPKDEIGNYFFIKNAKISFVLYCIFLLSFC